MTAKQPKEVAATSTDLWSIGWELEGASVQLHRVQNLLYIFDERMESDLGFVKECHNGPAKAFLDRYDMLHSVMELMQLHMNEAINALQVQIDAVYEASEKTKHKPLPAKM